MKAYFETQYENEFAIVKLYNEGHQKVASCVTHNTPEDIEFTKSEMMENYINENKEIK